MMQMARVSDETATTLNLDAAHDPLMAGGKAAALASLKQAGHRVPPGFVLPVALCRTIGGDVSSALRDVVARGLAEIGGGRVAVRSSAVAEDGAEASFAGQFLTVLNVDGVEDTCAAILRCVAARNASNVRAYADGAPLAIAVLVQCMVDADTAGVAFSVNPTTGDDEVVIAAVEGLGERLVQGEVSGETWIVANEKVREAPGTCHAIDDEDTLRIAQLARRLAKERGGPQDIEWALSDGGLYVLQSRPVTAVPVKPSFDDDPTEGTWTRDNVHYPTGVSAFAASTYQVILDRTIGAVFPEHGLMIDGLELHWRAGEMYGRLRTPGGKDGPPPPWWVIAVVVRLLPQARERMRRAARMVDEGIMDARVAAWRATGRAALEREIRQTDAVDLAALSDDDLLAHLDSVLLLMERGQRTHFELFFPYAVGLHRFTCIARELLGWDDARILALLAGSSTMSSAPGRELDELARRLRAIDGAADALDAEDPVAALRPVDGEVVKALDDWLRRWGLRAINYDSASPTYSEKPALLHSLVREAFREEFAATEVDVASKPIAEARALLSGPDRKRFDRALAEARAIYPLREENVLYTDNLICGLSRRALLAIAHRLCARGLLRHPQQVCDLMHAEVVAALRGERDDVLALAKRRRAECAWVAAHPGPGVLCGEVHPPPSMRGLPKQGRTINEAIMWMVSLEYPELTGIAPASPTPGQLSGIGAWPGSYSGIARLVRGENDFERVRAGDVLVAPITTPAWSLVFPRIGALVTDEGGALSHTAIVAREHGIPTVMNTKVATQTLKDGMRITVDGTRGAVSIDSEPS